MKNYPLGAEELRELDGDALTGYWCKGHHEPTEFVAHLAADWDVKVEIAQIHHGYWRLVPATWYDDPPPMCFFRCKGPARGAFPVTFVDL